MKNRILRFLMALIIVFGAFTAFNTGTINAKTLENQDEEISEYSLKEYVALMSYKKNYNMISNSWSEHSHVYRSLWVKNGASYSESVSRTNHWNGFTDTYTRTWRTY